MLVGCVVLVFVGAALHALTSMMLCWPRRGVHAGVIGIGQHSTWANPEPRRPPFAGFYPVGLPCLRVFLTPLLLLLTVVGFDSINK